MRPDASSPISSVSRSDRLHADHGVRRYRILRSQLDAARVIVHRDFDSDQDADAFLPRLARIWATPPSQGQLVDHEPPEVLTLVTDRVPQA